ncbi:MAG: alpha-hydroxy-acid oxidizing protein [Deltaproteobacteria bacterium]|nr:alpha-hydroxy-acid oxidizing protein [Deltaproteobacteria bacterium]
MPDTAAKLLGQPLKTPIMVAPMCNSVANTGGGLTERELVTALVSGSHLAGSLGWIGDPADEGLFADAISAVENTGRGVVIIKPRLDHDNIMERFTLAEKAGAVAVGLDIDGAGLLLMKLKGQAVGPKTRDQIAELARATRLPFIVKGIMTVDEAVICAEAGVSAIVVSNHGGRVLDQTPGTAAVLPEIAREVHGKVTVLVDGGVRSGVDALKMLALGAAGVLVGRPLLVGAYGAGAEGVRFLLEKYTAELYAAMILTGCPSLAEISPRILA